VRLLKIDIPATDEEVAARAADVLGDVVSATPAAVLGLPTGATPLGLYAELARRVRDEGLDLSGVAGFAIDELHGVPPGHPATNASYFREHVTSRLTLRTLRLLDSEAPDPERECARFDALIAEAGGLDLVVLGIGVNGHIAFNEPGSPFDSRCRRVALERSTREPYVRRFGSIDATPSHGLTVGIADIMAARRVLLLAIGADKASIVARALEGPVTEEVPASVLQRHSAVVALLDREAAALVAGR
jgi:glucosamine-6-phosphate deaminase